MVVAWTLTTGEAGMRSQAFGLATAVAEKVVEIVAPRGMSLAALAPKWVSPPSVAALEPPWPDIVVSCGRRSVPYALEVKRRSESRSLLVHVQDPRGAAKRFDLVVAMAHDRIAARPRVIKVATALHDLTPTLLNTAADLWREQFQKLGRRLAGVTVGGDLKGRSFTLEDAGRLIEGLARMRCGTDMGMAITPSRRTPLPIRSLFAETYRDDPSVFLWDLEGDNPYRAILGLADRLIVTGDSVSMVSEAISTTQAVDVLDLGFPRHAGFLQALVDAGRVRRFDGDPHFPAVAPAINATDEAAAAVRRILQSRTGLSG